MAKIKLNETLVEDMNYKVSENKSKRPGVLKTIHGNITDYLANRNGRIYGKSF